MGRDGTDRRRRDRLGRGFAAGLLNLRLDANAQNVIVDNVIGAGKNYGHSDALADHHINFFVDFDTV